MPSMMMGVEENVAIAKSEEGNRVGLVVDKNKNL